MAAKKSASTAGIKSKAKSKVQAPEVVVTPVRNTPVPPESKMASTSKSAPTWNAIAVRAYSIWQANGGSEFDNWIRAERELAGL